MNKQIYRYQIWSSVRARPDHSNFARYAVWTVALVIAGYLAAAAFLGEVSR